jgi:hypothetical protein
LPRGALPDPALKTQKLSDPLDTEKEDNSSAGGHAYSDVVAVYAYWSVLWSGLLCDGDRYRTATHFLPRINCPPNRASTSAWR